MDLSEVLTQRLVVESHSVHQFLNDSKDLSKQNPDNLITEPTPFFKMFHKIKYLWDRSPLNEWTEGECELFKGLNIVVNNIR